MKMGRFDESIVQYRKALEADSTFNASYIGIAHNQMFLGQGGEARATMDEMFAQAPNDGVRTNALLWKAAAYLHEGNRARAMEVLAERRAISADLASARDLHGAAYVGSGACRACHQEHHAEHRRGLGE